MPYVPAGTELDEYQGKHYVSIVGFMFLKTRVLGVPIPFHMNFEEVNLRFYIRRYVETEDGQELRRAVAFVKELVPRYMIARVARDAYNEPYEALPMKHMFDPEMSLSDLKQVNEHAGKHPSKLEYMWNKAQRTHAIRAEMHGAPEPLQDGTHEEFIAEHYWGYTPQKDGSTKEYKVEHPRWQVWKQVDAQLDCDVALMYGEQFASFIKPKPDTAFVALGSEVKVYPGKRIQ